LRAVAFAMALFYAIHISKNLANPAK